MNIIQKTFIMAMILIAIAISLNLLYPLDHERLYKPQSTRIYDRNHHLLALKLSSDGYLRIPISKEEITPMIKEILYAYEDRYFERHWGVNPLSILRALYANLYHQQHIGASTLSMQVARMMHHKPRTLRQKIVEIFQAFQLEWYYSKEEILLFYLNNTPYGGNIEGFASASYRYFGLPPSSLSVAQIAYLVSIPKNPNRNRPKPNTNIDAIKNRLLDRIYALKCIDPLHYQTAKAEHLQVKIHPLINRIPHLAVAIKEGGEVNTTIDGLLQEQITNLLYHQSQKLHPFGIYNGAAIVIDNQKMQILAYVGSPSFQDKVHGGENDGIKALISPGSTLKPFVYAKALEEGIITPLKKLYDLPLFIEGYKPKNYAKNYLGEVTATQALQLSLNIPAVELDRLLKRESLYSLLKRCDIPSLTHPKAYYGSALVLGGWGLSLWHNAELFAMLANRGVFQNASFLQGVEHKRQKILTPQSTYLISNILANAPRPEFSSSWEFIKSMPKIAFKTGTSAHAKDILTLGYTPHYTVGVWYGNFSGRSSHNYHHQYATGLRGASPTLFKIFALLGGKEEWFAKPKGITPKTICQDPIKLDTCQQSIEDYQIQGVTPHTPCSAMRAEVLQYLLKTQRIRTITQLEHHPCYPQWRTYKPLITNPINHKRYLFNRQLPKELKKTMLQCYSFEPNSTIYWLIDHNTPIRSQSGKKIYQYLTPAHHTITCLDEGAKRQSIEINIEEF
jgi:penicillin-binding protein 1C